MRRGGFVSLLAGFVGLAVLQLYLSRYAYSDSLHSYFAYYALGKTLVWLAGIFILLLIVYGYVRTAILQFQRLGLTLCGVVFAIWTLEWLMVFYPATETTEHALTHYTWMAFYRQPLNEAGFRDASLQRDTTGKKIAVFVGDSYTEGVGITETENTFPGIVKNKLGDNWVVYNLGKKAANTLDQITFFNQYAPPGSVVIWQYLFNDIDYICFENVNMDSIANMYWGLSEMQKHIVSRSYIFNTLYLKYGKFFQFYQYSSILMECGSNTNSLNRQKLMLETIVRKARLSKNQLVVLIMPYMPEPYLFKSQEDSVIAFFTRQNIPVLDMREDAQLMEYHNRMVSNQDIHPSKAFHAVTAEKVISYLESEGITR